MSRKSAAGSAGRRPDRTADHSDQNEARTWRARLREVRERVLRGEISHLVARIHIRDIVKGVEAKDRVAAERAGAVLAREIEVLWKGPGYTHAKDRLGSTFERGTADADPDRDSDRAQESEGSREGVLKVVTLEELLALDLPPREVILEPWLLKKDLVMIHAPRGCGKTWVSVGIAVAVSGGGSFLGWQAAKPRSVLYVDGEMPVEALRERLQRMAQIGKTDARRLRIITPDLQEFGVPNLATADGQHRIEQALGDSEVLVLDNLSALVRSGKENEAESWQPIQDFILRLRSRGLAVVFIHHSGKGGLQRGTSRREDVLSVTINLRRPADYQPTEGARFEIHFEKARALYGQEVEPFEARLDSDKWSVRTLNQTTEEAAIRLAREGLSPREIADALKKAPSHIYRILKEARRKGKLPSERSRA